MGQNTVKSLILALVLIVSLASAFAAVDVTYNFNQPVAEIHAFDCLDASCSQVRDFSGEILTSNPTSNSQIVVRFPDSPATNFKYALFYTSPGYRPYEAKVSAHSNGASTIHEVSSNIDFTKIDTCRAQVSDFSVLNNVRANIPVVVDISASLDATTSSAFEKVDQGIGFIPQEIIDEFYSADTRVSLEIYRDNQLVDTLTQELTAANGNPIFAESSRRVEFTYIPRVDGNYEARVVAEVIDPICAQTESQSSSSQFSVLPEEPLNQCYTILNNLDISNSRPRLDEELTVTFNKITNFADSNGVLSPIQTDVDILVVDDQGNTLFSQNGLTYVANPNSVDPTEQTFTFSPQNVGHHTITVTGSSSDILCQSTQNHAQSVSMNFFVDDVFSGSPLTFTVKDRQDNPISGVEVDIDGVGEVTTDGAGKATFNLLPGTYLYEMQRVGFLPKSGRFTMGNGEKNLFVLLTPGEYELPDDIDDDDLDDSQNQPPRLTLPDEVRVVVGQTKVVALDNYVEDAQDGPQDLFFSTDLDNSSLSIVIDNGIASILASAAGSTTVEFTVEDRGGETDSDSFTIVADTATSAPVFGPLPTIMLNEDTHFFRALYLPSFVNDSDTPSSDLAFSLSINESLAGVSISNGFVEVSPSRDFFGSVQGQVTVSDGTNSDSTTLTVIINGTEDDPILQRIPNIGNIPPGQNVTINLSDIVLDPDQTNLSFTVLNNDNDLGFIIEETLDLLTLITGTNLHQSTQFTLQINNSNGGFTLLENITLDLTSVNDPPFFTQTIPNLNVTEGGGQASIDLTPFEDDQEDGPGDNNNALTWTIVNSNSSNVNTSFDSALDFLVVTSVGDFFGSHVLTLVLTDSQGLNASQNITVNVANTPDDPVLGSFGNQTVEFGDALVLQLNASDVDLETLSFTSSNTNITIGTSGLFNFTPTFFGAQQSLITVCDTTSACDSQNFTLTVQDTTPPSNISTAQPAAPIVYATDLVIPINLTFVDNDGIASVDFHLDGALFNSSNVTQTGPFDYTINLSDLAAGNYTYQWFITDNGSNTNSSDLGNFSIERASSNGTLLLNGSASNIAVPDNTTILINATLFVPLNSSFEVLINNSTVQSVNASMNNTVVFNRTFVGEGTLHTVELRFAGNQNFTEFSQNFNVSVADNTNPSITNVTVSPVSGLLPQASYNFSAIVSDNIALANVSLELDGSNQTNLSVQGSQYSFVTSNISVGNHTFRWIAIDSSGNVNSTTLENYTVLADTTAPNITNVTSAPVNGTVFGQASYNFSAIITDNAALNNVFFEFDGTNQTNVSQNGSVFSLSLPTIEAGTHTFRWHANDTSGNVNTSALQTYVVTQASPSLILSASPSTSVTFGTQTTLNCTTTSPVSLNLSRNGTGVSNPDVQNLSAGTYLYVCSTSGNTNFTAASVNTTVTVNKAAQTGITNVSNQLGNATVIVNQTIPFTITNTLGTDNMTVLINGTQVAQGTGPLSFNQTFNTTEDQSMVVVLEGNENFTQTNLTRTISVLPNMIFQKFNVTPASGSLINSSFTLSFDTTNATQCRASTTDTDFASMTTSLDSSATLFHNGTVFIPNLGAATVHVSCVGENNSNNLDLSYTVQNIILQSTIDNSSANNSIINQSTIQVDSLLSNSNVQNSLINFTSLIGTNVTDSNVTGSSLNSCVIRNSTVKNIAATNCVIEDSFADPPTPNVDLSGSNITGDSNIIISNVTNSNVDASNLTLSNVNASNIQSCSLLNVDAERATMINCTLQFATLTPGTIINGSQITNGTINASVFYNASASGPANLSDLVNYDPVSSFTVSDTTPTTSDIVTFTSTSTDVNIGGALNDTLTFFYNFSDGSNATTQNATHSFSSTGSFVVNFTVTDRFNRTSSSAQTITVSSPSSGGGSGGSGGGSGGGGGSSSRSFSRSGSSFNSTLVTTPSQDPDVSFKSVTLTPVPKTFTLELFEGVRFSAVGQKHELYLSALDQTAIVLNNDTLSLDEVEFNLDESDFNELELKVLEETDDSVTLTLRILEPKPEVLDLSGTILDADVDSTVELVIEPTISALDKVRDWAQNSDLATQGIVVFVVVLLGLALYGLGTLLVR